MPIEIRKLVIQAKVADKTITPVAKNISSSGDHRQEETQQIIEACVKAVLKILKQEKAR